MNKDPKSISRRSFLGKTGTLAAGLTFINTSSLSGKETYSGARDFPLTHGITEPGLFAETGNMITNYEEKWWQREPLRIIELEEGYNPSAKMELLKDLGAGMEHVTRFTDTSPGTSFLDAHNLFGGEKVNFNTLDPYLAEAHKNNIRVVIYFNVHAIEMSYARKHPDWQQIRDDGKPVEDVYIVDSSFCINSPWREEVFQTVRKLASYNIDGIFYDGPIFFAGSCYCESCRNLFREKYKKEIPSKTGLSVSRQSKGWSEIIEFQSDSIVRFLNDTNKILKEANPQLLFYMNGNTLGPSWPTGRDNRKIICETDILGAEGGFLYGEMAEPVYKPGAMAKLLETQAGGKPTVVFNAAKQSPWAFSILPPGEISIQYGQTITHQANVWLAIGPNPGMHREQIRVIRNYNNFIRENPDPYIKTESLASVALLWPHQSGNYYTGSSVPLTDFTKEMKAVKAGSLSDEFYGFYDGLSRNHITFDVIDEEALNNIPQRYDLIILPNATCLSSEAAGKVRDFVKNGGNIISTFETSLYNESGLKYDNFQLADVFGAENPADIFGPLNWDYITPSDNNHFTIKNIKQKYLNAPSYGLKTKAISGAPVMFCKPLPGSYSGSPVLSEYPFIIDNRYGKGRSLYMAGTFGGSLNRFHFPEYYMVLLNMVSQLSNQILRTENIPSSVEVNLRKKGNSVFLYLINFTSEMRRPIQRIIPVYDLKLELATNRTVKGIRALWTGKDMEFVNNGTSVSFNIPSVENYEVLEIRT